MEAAQTSDLPQATLEWKVTGLKEIFQTSEGESKSQVIRSEKFGQDKWQLLFYANAGIKDGHCASVYLSCEPTAEELRSSRDGKWFREGKYHFSVEIRSPDGLQSLVNKEVWGHTFSQRTANWGWADIGRREDIFYNSEAVKEADTFFIFCSVSPDDTPESPI